MNIEVIRTVEIGPFEYQWWGRGMLERFSRGWDLEITADGERADVRHGIGRRDAYGRSRVHSVTWVNGNPTVEGVEADDYERTGELLSVIKTPDKKHARTLTDVPEAYRGFPKVTHRAEIDAPHSPTSLAVKLREDDLDSWVRLALVRARDYGRLRGGVRAAGATLSGTGRLPVQRQNAKPVANGGPSLGLRALLELEGGVEPEDLRRYLKLYEQATGYDRSLGRLRAAIGPGLDLESTVHRDSLLEWLRAWGCRHLARRDAGTSSELLATWGRLWVPRLPARDEHLTDLDDDAITHGALAFTSLAGSPAAFRNRRTGQVAVTFGPTAAAKAMFALRPLAFAPWDDPIREALGLSTNDAAYRSYLMLVRRALRLLAERVGVGVAELPASLGRPNSTAPKLVDEYLWIRITRGQV